MPQCRAKAKSTGQQCQRSAVAGCPTCRVHGSGTAAAKAAGAQRVEEQKAAKELQRRGYQRVENPLAALLDVAGELAAVKELFSERASRLDEDELRYRGPHGEEIHGVLKLYLENLHELGRLLSRISALKIDERLAAINDQQAAVVGQALQAALDRLGLDAEQTEKARRFVVEEITRNADRIDGSPRRLERA